MEAMLFVKIVLTPVLNVLEVAPSVILVQILTDQGPIVLVMLLILILELLLVLLAILSVVHVLDSQIIVTLV